MASDLKLAYPGSSDFTCTLASLPTSSSLLVGRQTTAFDNSSNKYEDGGLSGVIYTGTSPSAGLIEVWAFALQNDTTWPDAFGATDAGVTVTSGDIKNSAMALVCRMVTDSTSNRGYPIRPVGVRRLFNDFMPYKFGLWVTHNTGVNLKSSGSVLSITPVYGTAS